ncbi:MAG TPA: pyridoxamine 5'-phosphate oxidase [Methylomirabilota bacterium]|nr:pyridoxamine 5'-phosphate oxidase [Methylomirabilota bacterium]
MPGSSIADLRREYSLGGLSEADLDPDPIRQFRKWFEEATAAGLIEPNAMVLATVGTGGQPSTRTVLLKAVDERGFGFFTNYESRKGRELAQNPGAAVTFPWLALERQVNVVGRVTPLSRAEAEQYFKLRPRGSRLGACVSRQSEVIPGRHVLEQRLAELERAYPGDDIPTPPQWGGYLLVPAEIEFWQGRPNRLHDRLRYRRGTHGTWCIERLSP